MQTEPLGRVTTRCTSLALRFEVVVHLDKVPSLYKFTLRRGSQVNLKWLPTRRNFLNQLEGLLCSIPERTWCRNLLISIVIRHFLQARTTGFFSPSTHRSACSTRELLQGLLSYTLAKTKPNQTVFHQVSVPRITTRQLATSFSALVLVAKVHSASSHHVFQSSQDAL